MSKSVFTHYLIQCKYVKSMMITTTTRNDAKARNTRVCYNK